MDAIAEFKLRRQPTPLAAYLHLYTATRRQCYLDYMKGAKLLAAWLAPIEITPHPSHTIPSILRTYELNELAKAILPHTTDTTYNTYQYIEDAIYDYYQ